MYTVDEITAIGKKVLLLVNVCHVVFRQHSTRNDGSQSEVGEWTPFEGNSKADVQKNTPIITKKSKQIQVEEQTWKRIATEWQKEDGKLTCIQKSMHHFIQNILVSLQDFYAYALSPQSSNTY